MNKVIRDVLDAVFSFSTFMLVMVVFWGYILGTMLEKQDRDRELVRAQSAHCYSLSMVRVETDAGIRCVAPNALVEVK